MMHAVVDVRDNVLLVVVEDARMDVARLVLEIVAVLVSLLVGIRAMEMLLLKVIHPDPHAMLHVLLQLLLQLVATTRVHTRAHPVQLFHPHMNREVSSQPPKSITHYRIKFRTLLE